MLAKLTKSTPRSADLGLLIVRLWFGLVLCFGHGLSKLTAPGKFLASVEARGFPAPEILGVLAIVSEFFGGLLLALGLLTRPAALFVLMTMLVAAFFVHADDPFSKKEFALAYGMAAFALLVSGAGRYSVDARLR